MRVSLSVCPIAAPLSIRSSYAINIFDTFIRAQAHSYVNIDASTQHQIQVKVEKKKFHRDLFVQAEQVITRMLENDVFRRFTSTPEYKDMMEAGNIPSIPTATPAPPPSASASKKPRGSLTPATVLKPSGNTSGPPISGPGAAQSHGRSPSGAAMALRRPSFSMIAAEDDLASLMDIERAWRKSPSLLKKPNGPFDGATLVSWLLNQKYCSTRLAGEHLGQRLMDALLLRGDDTRRTFVDSPFLYHLFDEWYVTPDKIPDMMKNDEAGEVLVKGARYSRWFMILHEASQKLFCYLPMEQPHDEHDTNPPPRIGDRWTPDSINNTTTTSNNNNSNNDEQKSTINNGPAASSASFSTPRSNKSVSYSTASPPAPASSPSSSSHNTGGVSPLQLSSKPPVSPFASPRLGPQSASPTTPRPALRSKSMASPSSSSAAQAFQPDFLSLARGSVFTRYAYPGTPLQAPATPPLSSTPPSPSSILHHSGSSPSLSRRGSGPHVTTVPTVTGGSTERVYVYLQPTEGKGFLHWTPSRRQEGHQPTPAQFAAAAQATFAQAGGTSVSSGGASVVISKERRSPSMDMDTAIRFGSPVPLTTINESTKINVALTNTSSATTITTTSTSTTAGSAGVNPQLHITPPVNSGAPVLMINTHMSGTTVPAPLSSPSSRNELRRSGPTVAHGHARSRSLTTIIPVTHTIDLDDLSVNIRVGRMKTSLERSGQVDTTVDPQCCSQHEGRCLSILIAAAPATPETGGYSEEELHLEPEHDIDFAIWLHSLIHILGRAAANSFDGVLPTAPSHGRVMSFTSDPPTILGRPPSSEKEPEHSPVSPMSPRPMTSNTTDNLPPSALSSTSSSGVSSLQGSLLRALTPSKREELKEKKKTNLHKKSHTVAFGLPSAGSLKDLRALAAAASSSTASTSSSGIDMEEMAARFGEARLVVDLRGTTGRLLEDPFSSMFTCYLYLDTQLPAYPMLLRLDERGERDRWVAAFNRVGVKFKFENIDEYIPDDSGDTAGLSGGGSTCQVFLGGSCNPTTWRRDIAVPELTKHKITFYNPQVENWSPALMRTELKYKEQSSVLFFVIDDQTRAIASMVEVAEYLSRDRYMVVVIKDVPEGTNIGGQSITGQELLGMIFIIFPLIFYLSYQPLCHSSFCHM
jgi:hypothetical protein